MKRDYRTQKILNSIFGFRLTLETSTKKKVGNMLIIPFDHYLFPISIFIVKISQ